MRLIFAVIISFSLGAGTHGVLTSDTRFKTIADCEGQKASAVTILTKAMVATHGAAFKVTGARCGIPVDASTTHA